jgi:DNA-binding protein HU-beta
MKILNKNDIAVESSKITGISLEQTEEVIDSMFEVISNELKKGNQCRFKNYFCLRLKSTKDKVGTHPQTGERLEIKARKTVAVKISDKLKEFVK